MKIFFILIFFISLTLAETKEEEIKNSDLKIMVELIKLNQEATNKRFEDMQKSMDKRFEDMQKNMDKRFEQVDKRFEDMQKNMDKRFEQVDKRFEQVDKRFEQVDKRFEDMKGYMDKRFDAIFTFFGIMISLMIAGFGIVITYLVKERGLMNVMQKDLKVEVEKLDSSLKDKADKKVVEKLIEIVERLAKDDSEIQEMLKKHHLSYQG